MIKKIVVIVLCFITITAFSKHQFKRIGIEQGLSGFSASCVFEDNEGYIWIGTSNGLNRFDGYKCKNYFYNKTDSNSLASNEVYTVFEDSNNNLFIGSGGGLQLYNKQTDNFSLIKLPHLSYPVKSLLQDKKGNIWIGTYGGGLFQYIQNKLIPSPYKQLNYLSISCLYEDKIGNVWVGTEKAGIYILDRNFGTLSKFQKKLEPSNRDFDFSDIKVRGISQDISGTIWIATYGNGVFQYSYSQPNLIRNVDSKIGTTNALASSIQAGNNGEMYIGYDGGGVLMFNTKTQQKEIYKQEIGNINSLLGNAVQALLIDRHQNLWIASYQGGVSIKSLKQASFFKIYNTEPNSLVVLPHNNITGVSIDKKDNVWIASDGGGLSHFDVTKKLVKQIQPKPFLNMQYSNALCVMGDTSGNIWSGFYRGGFVSIDANTLKMKQFCDEEIQISQTGIANDIRTITNDRNGNYWIGTNGQGLICFKPQSGITRRLIKDYSDTVAGLTSNFIRAVFEDSKGYLWIGSTYGLTRFDPIKNVYLNLYEEKNNAKSLLSNSILSIKESTDGYIYVGTAEGLSVLETPVWSKEYDEVSILPNTNKNEAPQDKKLSILKRFLQFIHIESSNEKADTKVFSFKNYSIVDGLPDRAIYCIVEDNNQHLWMGTGKGLSLFIPKKEMFLNFSISEEDPDIFNTGACFKDNTGKLYFGGINGLVSFYPDSMKGSGDLQTVQLTDIIVNFESIFKVNNKKLFVENGVLELGNREKAISFEFSALEMFYSNEIKYEYKLEGFDNAWRHADAGRRFATYTNLKAGEYKFLIRASNRSGLWNENATQLTIIVHPPFYRTWWFGISLTILLLVAIYAFYIFRIKSISTRNKKLEKIVAQRTKELMSERDKQKAIELEHNKMIIKQKELEAFRLKAEKELVESKNESLQYEVERQTVEMQKKNSELVALAVQTTQKIEFLAKLKNSLGDLLTKANPEMQLMINALIRQIEKDSDVKKDWEQFEQHFNQANNNFFIALKEKYPDLTPHDIRMCAYLRMNLSNKEIAALQNISLRGVEKSRFRLRKKMKLEGDENIVSFLMAFNL